MSFEGFMGAALSPPAPGGKGRQCRRFEVPTNGCRKLVQELQIESGTEVMNLLVPLCFRRSCQRLLRLSPRASDAGHRSSPQTKRPFVIRSLLGFCDQLYI
ncbi:MAG: hypothetical protein ACJ8E1_09055, partial [Xanthobacteraceae bacterium]